MKKTKALSLLLSLLLLLSSLTLPLLAVDAETAADPEQTQTDSADAPAEDDSVPEDRLLSSRTSFSVAAKAALLIDLNTGRAVYEQDADERVYPASLTKIMTCLLALENGNLSDVVTVSASALDDLDADSSVAGLQVGEQMTLENLLYCMMVVSGNDACNVIAEHIAGSVADFVRMMNQRAYELGCLNTHFSNPHGLHDESHYTTARDLSIITQAALKSENFRQIVAPCPIRSIIRARTASRPAIPVRQAAASFPRRRATVLIFWASSAAQPRRCLTAAICSWRTLRSAHGCSTMALTITHTCRSCRLCTRSTR